ncbi:MAG: hypothetical protein AB7F86_05985 [Bdellovibrionales bacterium]
MLKAHSWRLMGRILFVFGLLGAQTGHADAKFDCELELLELVKGAQISIEGQAYKVRQVVEDGHKSLVYRLKAEDGRRLALKIARPGDPSNLESLQKEVGKVAAIEKLGLPQARILASGQKFLLKEWVQGVRGDVWISSWLASGSSTQDPKFQDLKKLFRQLAEMKIYLGNLKDLNLIYDGTKWVIVDAGKIEKRDSVEELLKEYAEVFWRRWVHGDSRGKPMKFHISR